MIDPAHAQTLVPGAPPGAEGAGGLPQFDIAMWPGQIVWVLVVFGILYVLFARVFVPRIADTIGEREDKIAGDIGDARRLRDAARADMDAAAAEMVQARARAQKVAAEAAAEAKAVSAAREAQEEARLAETLAAAEARIAEARASAMVHVRSIAVETAQAIIGRLTGTEAAPEEIQRALDASPAPAA
jgi:F-type H+-transporting ATPase subunit b